MKGEIRSSAKIKFIVDGMLGTLSRWLRLAGYDALFFEHVDDREILKKAREETRIVLTRDTRLLQRKPIKQQAIRALLVGPGPVEAQLKQVAEVFQLDLEINRPFCNLCNVSLIEVSKAEVAGKVPPFVCRTQEHFSFCPSCSRYFWAGTHWQRITDKMKKVRNDIEKAADQRK